jgi:hypothetical protein
MKLSAGYGKYPLPCPIQTRPIRTSNPPKPYASFTIAISLFQIREQKK